MVQTTKNASDAIKQKDEMQAEFENLRQEHSKVEEAVQQSSHDSSREKNEFVERLQNVQKENISLAEKFDDLLANSSAEIAELKVNLDKIQEDNEVHLSLVFKVAKFTFFRLIVCQERKVAK